MAPYGHLHLLFPAWQYRKASHRAILLQSIRDLGGQAQSCVDCGALKGSRGVKK